MHIIFTGSLRPERQTWRWRSSGENEVLSSPDPHSQDPVPMPGTGQVGREEEREGGSE